MRETIYLRYIRWFGANKFNLRQCILPTGVCDVNFECRHTLRDNRSLDKYIKAVKIKFNSKHHLLAAFICKFNQMQTCSSQLMLGNFLVQQLAQICRGQHILNETNGINSKPKIGFYRMRSKSNLGNRKAMSPNS
jgi:hypothetical protein